MVRMMFSSVQMHDPAGPIFMFADGSAARGPIEVEIAPYESADGDRVMVMEKVGFEVEGGQDSTAAAWATVWVSLLGKAPLERV